jgi:hypothetical protein
MAKKAKKSAKKAPKNTKKTAKKAFKTVTRKSGAKKDGHTNRQSWSKDDLKQLRPSSKKIHPPV